MKSLLLILLFTPMLAAASTSQLFRCPSPQADGPDITITATDDGELELPQGKIRIDPATAKALVHGDLGHLNKVSTLAKDGETHVSFRTSGQKLSQQTYLDLQVDSKTQHEHLGGCWATSDEDRFLLQ